MTPLSRSDKISSIRRFIEPRVKAGLEIGPDVAPLFRKSEGYRVSYTGARSTEQLFSPDD